MTEAIELPERLKANVLKAAQRIDEALAELRKENPSLYADPVIRRILSARAVLSLLGAPAAGSTVAAADHEALAAVVRDEQGNPVDFYEVDEAQAERAATEALGEKAESEIAGVLACLRHFAASKASQPGLLVGGKAIDRVRSALHWVGVTVDKLRGRVSAELLAALEAGRQSLQVLDWQVKTAPTQKFQSAEHQLVTELAPIYRRATNRPPTSSYQGMIEAQTGAFLDFVAACIEATGNHPPQGLGDLIRDARKAYGL